jgi:predicted nucleic acid-binding protein
MRVFVDTGVLLRAFDRLSPERPAILRALRRLWAERHDLYTSAQNIAEFWNVSTRPISARGGYGRPVPVVESRVRQIERWATILSFSPPTYAEWRRLLVLHQLIGVSVHDARIAATMLTDHISHLVTLNRSDFLRYSGIVVLSPEDVLTVGISTSSAGGGF